MTDIFLEVLNTSIAAGWVVLAVVLARLVLKRSPRSLVCGLWALVGLRLLLPFSLEAPFSLIPSTRTIPPESLFDQAPVIDSGVAVIDQIVNPVYTESFRANPVASVNPLQVWAAVWANLWILGMAAMGLWALVSWLRVRRQVRQSVEENGVFLCDRIDTPFLFGLFRPRIYLPSDLDDAAKVHVIAHERAHLARLDHWWKPLGFLLLTVNWFNPVLWLAYVLLCRDIELACDERVIRHFPAAEKKAYSSALLQCSLPRRAIAACPLAFGEVGVKARVKSVLHYKKPAFWVIVLAVVLSLVLAACFLTDPKSDTAEIRWNGVLYIQEGAPVDFVPDKQLSSGTLRSVLHDSTPHPTEDGQAVGLGWEYAGQPVVLVGNALYLKEPGGGSWLKFRCRPGNELLAQILREDPRHSILIQGGSVTLSENLTGAEHAALRALLEELTGSTMFPHPQPEQALDSMSTGISFQITLGPDHGQPPGFLCRTEQEGWMLVLRGTEYSDSVWQFRSDALDEFWKRYEAELECLEAAYAKYDTSINPVQLHYQTFSTDDIFLRVGLPVGWEAEEIDGPGFFGFQFRPEAVSQGWISVKFWDDAMVMFDYVGVAKPTTFPSGLTGDIYYPGGSDAWGAVYFRSSEDIMTIDQLETTGWARESLDAALDIIGSITVFDNGRSVFTQQDIGIQLSAEDITPNGLTLVCTQDGTPWREILTGSPWSLEQWTEDGWVSVMPESTVWTMVAYTVPQHEVTRWNLNWSLIRGALEPGTYRVGKHFTATPVPPPWLGVAQGTVEQTCYAEFTIE